MNEQGFNQDLTQLFQPGAQCLVLLMGERFMVKVLSTTPETVRVSFPMSDFPVPGVLVELELHDSTGYTGYKMEVMNTPNEVGEGLLLGKPDGGLRMHHRGSLRIASDFPVQVKGQVHPRRYQGVTINISSGGMLLRAKGGFDTGEMLDVTFLLPGDKEPLLLLGEVVHFAPMAAAPDERQMGVKFINPDADATSALRNYMMRRLREMHPQGLSFLRRMSDATGQAQSRRQGDPRA